MKSCVRAFCTTMYRLGLACCLSVMLTTGALAAWPERPITLIVPFGAGGGTDVPARLLAGMMEKKLGQPIIIQNIVGAGGSQGMAQVASAKADGYTFGYAPTGTLCLQPHITKTPYGVDSFDFIGTVTQQPVVLMTPKNAKWKNLEEMVKIVQAEPNKYIVGITSTGNMTHVPVVAIAEHLGLKLRYIPYRSTTEIMKDMTAGRIHFHADAPVALSQFEIYGLMQCSDKAVENLPMPSAKDIGMDRFFTHWQGVVTPKGIPTEALQTFSKVMEEVVTSPEFQSEATRLSTNAQWMPSADFKALFEHDFEAYGKLLETVLPKKK